MQKPAMPLKSYIDFSAFKLFVLDIGLLSAMSELDVDSVQLGNELFTEFKGALTEQYVLQQIIPVNYDLSSVLNDLVNMIQTKAEDKGLNLELNFNKEVPKYLFGDEIRIKQVITNLLTNAVKYTKKGTVTFMMDYKKDMSDSSSVILEFSVRDTGIGIRSEDISKLFSKFDRIEEKRNRTVEGTGLGMNITKELLDLMGSKLEVDSVYGLGSVFSFSLKQGVVKWEVLGDYDTAFRESVQKRKKYKELFTSPDSKILVVDDTIMNLKVFCQLAKKTRIDVETAESGDECLALAEKYRYDIIFLDHMIPSRIPAGQGFFHHG